MSDDPVRLIDAPDPPPELLELVRHLDPPPLPPAIRSSVRGRLPRPRVSPPWHVIGPTLAVAAVVGIGGVVAWRIHETPPQPLRHPVSSAAEAPSDASPPPSDAGEPETPIDHAAPSVPQAVDKRTLRSVVMPSLGRLQRCLERAVPEGRTQPFTIDVGIAADGRVTRAGFVGAPPSVGADCARAIARAWTFPAGPTARRAHVPFAVGSPSPPPARDAGTEASGHLMIQSIPWAHVFVDGQDTHRQTPVRRLEVSAGPHVVVLRTDDGIEDEVRVVVEPGEIVRIVRQLGRARPTRGAPRSERVEPRPVRFGAIQAGGRIF